MSISIFLAITPPAIAGTCRSCLHISFAVSPAVGPASPQEAPVPIHPGLLAILPRLQLVHDCWDLLNNQKEYYLPRGEREPDSAYKRRIDAALPSGFFRDALRTFAGMLTASHWRELPPSLQAVVSDVDGLGTDLGVFLERADLLVLRDGACLIAVTPPEHLWPSAGDYAQALRQGDRASLPKLQLIERADLLNWGHSPEGPSAATTLPTQLIYRSHGRPAGARSSGARPPLAQYVSVISGAAFVYWQYIEGCDRETYSRLENEARLKSLGIWQVPGGIQRPWDFRKSSKAGSSAGTTQARAQLPRSRR